MQASKQSLIAVSVESIQRSPHISSAVIAGVSENSELSFEIKTWLLNPEQLYHCELLQRHGSAVVEVPASWQWEYNEPSRWQEAVIKAAMERVAKRYETDEEINMTGTYDSDFAKKVLAVINQHFPHPVQTSQLKHDLDNEPSDSVLLTALAGLQREGFIEGKPHFESMTGRRDLIAMADIQITGVGRKHLAGASAPPPTATIIQGDQFNNYGQAGAIGHHSTGTLNYQSEWQTLQHQVDLSTISRELQRTIQQLHETASSSEDYQRLQMLAEAKAQADKKNGGKMFELLSKMGQNVLPIFAKCGAESIIRLIEDHLKHV